MNNNLQLYKYTVMNWSILSNVESEYAILMLILEKQPSSFKMFK